MIPLLKCLVCVLFLSHPPLLSPPSIPPDMTLLDEKGNKTSVPDKERQIEALQLLFLLLPQANRSLLKLILDLLYHTAKQQDKNKMSAFNLALMFAPHVVWPRDVCTATQIQIKCVL